MSLQRKWQPRTKHNNLKDLVFERDSYTCIFCEAHAADAHHVVRRSRGGRDVPQNLVAVCRWHHMMLHGQVKADDGWDVEQMDLAAMVYVSDYYAQMVENGTF
ncbi:hypothetical protein FACS1894217_01130 [Clostridia bacterium]|nr:hypothetical protein FACS1894217_01130 [Clostridia bacterium]